MGHDSKWAAPAIALGAAFGVGFLVAKTYFERKVEKEENILDIIRARRSIFPKQYSDKPVDRKVLEEMLEGSRWAPTHKITEPWKFIVYETTEGRSELGQFLADQYKETSAKFVEAKYNKKIANAKKSSFVVAIVCDTGKGKNPIIEEICSVAMAVQSMFLVATEHGVGAYWSSGGVFDKSAAATSSAPVVNPESTRDFLGLTESQILLGWIFIGSCEREKWPQGRRSEFEEGKSIFWK